MDFSHRFVDFEGAYNVRDLGGVPTNDGVTVRTGRVFRADSPRALTPGDREVVVGLDVRLVVDLRSGDEAEEGSWAVADHMERRNFPVIDPAELDPEAMRNHIDEAGFADRYLRRLQVSGPALADAARAVIRGVDGGVIFNCTAGKDRTGLLAAFLLTALGVGRDVVVADYEASTEPMRRHVTDRVAELAPGDPDPRSMPAVLVEAPALVMERTLDLADEQLGGIVASFQSHGVTDDDLAVLRDRLLD